MYYVQNVYIRRVNNVSVVVFGLVCCFYSTFCFRVDFIMVTAAICYLLLLLRAASAMADVAEKFVI